MTEAFYGLFGVGLGAVLSFLWEWLRAKSENAKRAKYLAVRVTHLLDDFVDQLALVSRDDGYLGEPRDQACSSSDFPEAPEFPDDVDWQSVDTQRAYDILSLENRVAVAKNVIARASDNAFPPDFEEAFDERMEQAANLGSFAVSLADSLRRDYGLPEKADAHNDWGAKNTLSKSLERIERDRAAKAEAARNAPNPFLYLNPTQTEES